MSRRAKSVGCLVPLRIVLDVSMELLLISGSPSRLRQAIGPEDASTGASMDPPKVSSRVFSVHLNCISEIDVIWEPVVLVVSQGWRPYIVIVTDHEAEDLVARWSRRATSRLIFA